ncbi:MAG: FKBP-type peptidyl-prolyl cis-trans isomerase [Bryobacteraceae bacterium]
MKQIPIVIAVALLGLIAGAAQPDARQAASPVAAPEDVAKPSADAERTGSGLAMRRLNAGTGTGHPGGNDCIRVRFIAWRPDGSLFSTSGLRGESQLQCMSNAIPGIAEALSWMLVGEKRRVWLPASLAVNADGEEASAPKKRRKRLSRDISLTFDVELVEVLKAPPVPVDLTRAPDEARTLASGIAIRSLIAANGEQHPAANSRVTVHYTCWTMAGKIVETTAFSGHPSSVQLGTALQGWQEGVPLMAAGETARLWIPAALAYGAKPANRKLPGGAQVCDIQLVSIE